MCFCLSTLFGMFANQISSYYYWQPCGHSTEHYRILAPWPIEALLDYRDHHVLAFAWRWTCPSALLSSVAWVNGPQYLRSVNTKEFEATVLITWEHFVLAAGSWNSPPVVNWESISSSARPINVLSEIGYGWHMFYPRRSRKTKFLNPNVRVRNCAQNSLY